MKRKKAHLHAHSDYLKVALQMADWSLLQQRASVEVGADHLADRDRRRTATAIAITQQ